MINPVLQKVTTRTNRQFIIEAGDTLYSERLSKSKGYQITNIIRLRDLVPTAKHIIDIGANIGNNSIEYATWADRVSAFEPTPHTRKWLEANIQHNKAFWTNDLGWYPEGEGWADLNPVGHIDVYPYALSDSPGTVQMLHHERNGGHNHIIPEKGSKSLKPRYSVEVRTLDSFGFVDVDAIKIDVEGWELPVLIGGEQTIMRDRPVVQTEIVAKQCRNAGYTPQDLCDWFHARDYTRTLKNGRIMGKQYEEVRRMMDSFWVPNEQLADNPNMLFEW